MKLRRQLLLVSLLALALPWAGCEYIREMENILRQGQAAALQATARAVAARLASDPEAQQLLLETAPDSRSGGQALYAHALDNAPHVDGYDDDWRALGFTPVQLAQADTDTAAVTLLAGKAGNELFLFCRMRDASPRYYTPLRPLNEVDHLQLVLQPEGKAATAFQVYTAAPGKVTVTTTDGQREHQISGVWQEWEAGYQLELRLPYGWTQQQFGLRIVDASESGHRVLGTLDTSSSVPPVVSRQPSLDAALKVFVGAPDSGVLLRLVTPRHWVVAEAGQHEAELSQNTNGGGLLSRIYRLALGKQWFPALDEPYNDGLLAGMEVEDAVNGKTQVAWYLRQGQQVVRAAVPVEVNGMPVAAVVAEQTTDTLRAMTDSAFSRLVTYSLAAFGLAGLGLLAYASWLSWRIRRLSQAADRAVDANGRIGQHFPRSRSKDELGELSRRYGDLLERLRQYTDYLETLASKLSHELRTPLAVVRSSLDNLDDASLTPEARVYSARAREGTDRLSKILTAMSAASRVEQSIQSAEREPVQLRGLLQELTLAYADAYPGVNWCLVANDEDDYRVIAAPELLVQMLDKLADNAADFCPPGETVTLQLERQARHLVLQVRNPGPPLPRQMRGQLFDSLVSVRDRESSGDHLGLGLHIVRLIANFHGGTVEADNGPDDSGAVFTVRFPAEP